MVIGISVKSNIKKFTKNLSNIQNKQVPFATSVAINETLKKVQRGEVAALSRYLDRPTPFTKRAYRIRFSDKRTLSGRLFTLPAQEEYLKLQIFGGTSNKPHPVPGKNAKLNAFGNLTRRQTKGKKIIHRNGKAFKKVGGKKSRRLQLVAHFPNSRTYHKKLPFFRIAKEIARRRFNREFNRAFSKALKTAR